MSKKETVSAPVVPSLSPVASLLFRSLDLLCLEASEISGSWVSGLLTGDMKGLRESIDDQNEEDFKNAVENLKSDLDRLERVPDSFGGRWDDTDALVIDLLRAALDEIQKKRAA